MRYCYQCNHITVGEPLFCNTCGRSFNVKLCPRLHVNPRSAEVCSQCGSRDLSKPQPRVPIWVPILEFVLSLIPGLFLALISIAVVAFAIHSILTSPQLMCWTVLLLIVLGILWWLWSQIPLWFRKAIHKMLMRKQNGEGRNGKR